jgi:CRP/FNR family transcriptional regulator
MTPNDPHFRPAHLAAAACTRCSLANGCLPASLSDAQLLRVEQVLTGVLHLQRGEYLYRTGQPFWALFVPRTGFVKTAALLEDGREQVLSFAMPADLLGADGIETGRYRSHAVALEDSTVCVAPLAELEAMGREMPILQRSLHRLMSREIVQEHHAISLLAGMPAPMRLAAFLLGLSRRFAARGYSETEFRLPMRREEIGSYLGLQHETVSRGLSRLADQGLIAVQTRCVRILDRRRLRQLAEGGDTPPDRPEHASVGRTRPATLLAARRASSGRSPSGTTG